MALAQKLGLILVRCYLFGSYYYSLLRALHMFLEDKNMEPKLTAKGTPLTDFISNLSKDAAEQQAQRWAVLRNHTRLRIIDLLNRYDGLLCVTEVAQVLDESLSLISSHLSILKDAGLVEAEKHQHYVYYRVKTNAFDGFWDYLETFVGQ